jgi:hypothetical protein
MTAQFTAKIQVKTDCKGKGKEGKLLCWRRRSKQQAEWKPHVPVGP